jgi:hypothetical protein
MQDVYVIGGQQRDLRSLHNTSVEWHGYHKGVILRVNPETQQATVVTEYTTPPQARPEGEASILLQAGTFQDDRLYACTQTEVLVYALPSFERIAYVSLPCFNDVHHVRPTPQGTILVANAGLDMVVEITLSGDVVRTWNVLGEDPWAHFSRDVDYRKVLSTKPHRSHPNFVFCIGDDVWATRFQQGDARCLTHPDRTIKVSDERIHDGLVHQGMIYFTTVSGKIVVANPKTLKVEHVVDLNQLHRKDTLLGWCRGIGFAEGKLWVGFSRIRPTKVRENVAWAMRGFRRVLGTRIACYDVQEMRCLADIDLEPAGLNVIFSVHPGVATPVAAAL